MKRRKGRAKEPSSPLVQHEQVSMFSPRRLVTLAGIIIAVLVAQVGYFYWQLNQGKMDYLSVQRQFDDYEQQLLDKQSLIDEFQQQLISKPSQPFNQH